MNYSELRLLTHNLPPEIQLFYSNQQLSFPITTLNADQHKKVIYFSNQGPTCCSHNALTIADLFQQPTEWQDYQIKVIFPKIQHQKRILGFKTAHNNLFFR